MSKQDLIRKITSRKFWLAITNFVAMLLAASGMPENEVAQIVALIMAGAGIAAYIFGEAWADAKNAGEVIPLIEEEAVAK